MIMTKTSKLRPTTRHASLVKNKSWAINMSYQDTDTAANCQELITHFMEIQSTLKTGSKKTQEPGLRDNLDVCPKTN